MPAGLSLISQAPENDQVRPQVLVGGGGGKQIRMHWHGLGDTGQDDVVDLIGISRR